VGQVSARTLYLVVMLNVVAGFIFNSIDSSRYGPCVTVFFGIALGCTAYAGWTARRRGVDLNAPRWWRGRSYTASRSTFSTCTPAGTIGTTAGLPLC
jgi:hypothetical protein